MSTDFTNETESIGTTTVEESMATESIEPGQTKSTESIDLESIEPKKTSFWPSFFTRSFFRNLS